MDDLDHALLNAWDRLTPALRQDRAEALRRALRRNTPTLTRPPRAWCLCVRAADSRLDALAAIAPYRALRTNAPHTITLDAPCIRKLTAPVHLPWPGMRLRRAAHLLGRHPESMRNWLDKGLLRIHHDPPRMHGSRGKPVPMVWAPSPLDPNANLAQAPHHAWGTIWQYHHTRVPDHLTLTTERCMRYRHDPRGSNDRALGRPRGWLFECPGLPHAPCNRLVQRLYYPLPVTTLADYLNEDPLDITIPLTSQSPKRKRGANPPPQDESDAEQADGGQTGRPPSSLRRFVPSSLPFACHHCHRVRYLTLDRNGWNHLVTHLTAGLLYGHEVPRPDSITHTRKRRYVTHSRPHPRRDQVQSLLLRGLTSKQIATALGIQYSTVVAHIERIYKHHAVHSRAELKAKLTPPTPTQSACATAL